MAAVLARHFRPDGRLVVTTVTPTGQREAQRLFGTQAQVRYLPYDLFFTVRRFVDWAKPAALILTEGDYWPYLLSVLRRSDVPVYVVNGRISDRGYGRMRSVPAWLVRRYLRNVTAFAMQSKADCERLIDLGIDADKVAVTGNIKFDTPAPEPQPELEQRIEQLAGGRAILIAGSSMEGEEEVILDALGKLQRRALLVLAPRHPERALAVEQLARARGFRADLRSRLDEIQTSDDIQVLVLDSIGELAALYRLAKGVFVGGTLVPTGGHNPLEPAQFSAPIATGPSMENFRAVADAFEARDAWRRVTSAPELARAWSDWLDRPDQAAALGERGRQVLDANRGAVAKTIDFLQPALENWKPEHWKRRTEPPS